MAPPRGRPLWVGTSWEMNKTLAEADSFVDELLTFTVAAASSRSPKGRGPAKSPRRRTPVHAPAEHRLMVERKGWRHAKPDMR
jgi:hypothetical protein